MPTDKPRLVVMASTYPRWAGDHEPGFVHALCMRLADTFDIKVVAPHAPGAACTEMMDGVSVHRFRYAPERMECLVNDGGIVANLRRRPWTWLLVPVFLGGFTLATWRMAKAWKPDVIHAHWILPYGLIAVLVARMLSQGVPVMVTGHGSDVVALRSRLARWLRCLVVRHANRVTVVGGALHARLSRECGGGANVSIEPMGVDVLGRFAPASTGTRSRTRILHVGRLVSGKGTRHVIDAMQAILSKFPEATLEIAGFGPEEPALRERVAVLGLAPAVVFLGAVPNHELPGLYRSAAVLAAPFEDGAEEGLGLVMVEAAACGCPVVAGDIEASRHVVSDATVGVIVPAGDANALAEAICAILGSPDLRDAEAARARAMQRFDWTVRARAYSDALLAVASPS